ncbi:molybdenum cofactor biosynthesis protein MoaE [Jonesiaceae bacterium BS-20]|uniref:Molybdenum cofactor biosynthesis protein MoaE n=1 Tax=Jonesiaceae bacterium BS-20 TaxID=3120821 RepID=A0AAU7DYK4_9MICO
MSDNEPSQVVLATIATTPITLTAHEDLAGCDWAGATVGFGGIVRDHDGGRSVTRLEYEGHPQAQQFITEIADRVAAKYQGVRIAVTHRVGVLEIGDVALAAAVASAHRAEAFAACAELVEDIKANLPIWKNQFFTDGTQEWVGSL